MNLHDALNKEEIQYEIIHILSVPKLDGNNTEKGAIALKTTKQFDMNVW